MQVVAISLCKLWHFHCADCGIFIVQVVAFSLCKLWHFHCADCGIFIVQVVAFSLCKLWILLSYLLHSIHLCLDYIKR